jgi:hypothetical protein
VAPGQALRERWRIPPRGKVVTREVVTIMSDITGGEMTRRQRVFAPGAWGNDYLRLWVNRGNHYWSISLCSMKAGSGLSGSTRSRESERSRQKSVVSFHARVLSLHHNPSLSGI